MTISYATPTINARLQATADKIDAGGSNGYLFLLSAGGTTLVSIQLARPCGTVSDGVLTFDGTLVDPAASATGDASSAQIQDSAGTRIATLTVGSPGGGQDILLAPTNAITAGQTVQITQATITGH